MIHIYTYYTYSRNNLHYIRDELTATYCFISYSYSVTMSSSFIYLQTWSFFPTCWLVILIVIGQHCGNVNWSNSTTYLCLIHHLLPISPFLLQTHSSNATLLLRSSSVLCKCLNCCRGRIKIPPNCPTTGTRSDGGDKGTFIVYMESYQSGQSCALPVASPSITQQVQQAIFIAILTIYHHLTHTQRLTASCVI